MNLRNNELRRLVVFLRPYLLMEFGLLVSLAILTLLSLAPVHFIRIAFDQAISTGNIRLLFIFCGVLLVLLIAKESLGYVHSIAFVKVGQKVLYDIRLKLFAKIMNLPPDFFFKYETGSIISRFIQDVEALQKFLTDSMLQLIIHVFTLVGFTIYLSFMDWRLTILGISLTLPFYIILYVPFHRRLTEKSLVFRESYDEVLKDLEETISGVREVQVYSMQKTETDEFSRNLTGFMDSVMSLTKTSMLTNSVISAVRGIGPIVILSFGGYICIKGELNAGELMAFILSVGTLFASMSSIISFMAEHSQIQPVARRISELLDIGTQQMKTDIPIADLKNFKYERCICFDDVSYEYNQSRPALNNISFSISKGEKIAIVGTSGSGKSTLFNLLFGFMHSSSGRITIDEADIRHVAIEELRKNIAFINQVPFLFNRSIKENITYGNPSATFTEIVSVCQKASVFDDILNIFLNRIIPAKDSEVVISLSHKELEAVHQRFKEKILTGEYSSEIEFSSSIAPGNMSRIYDWIMRIKTTDNLETSENYDKEIVKYLYGLIKESLEELTLIEKAFESGLSYIVGEMGRHISGGQAQRIAIARALLMNVPILLMDEPTSGLSREDINIIKQTINDIALKDKVTTIFVTHDLSIADSADNVIVLNNGKIVQRGTHSELIDLPGLYRKLYFHQFD